MDGRAGLDVETVSCWQALGEHQPFESAKKSICHFNMRRQFFAVRLVQQPQQCSPPILPKITPPLPKGGLMNICSVIHPDLSVAGWPSK